METRKTRINLVTSVSVLVASLAVTYYALAGSIQPTDPPGSTMHSLEDIYNAIGTASAGVLEREGYCQHHTVAGNSIETILTVPAGKRFVLLKFNCVTPSNAGSISWALIASDPSLGDTVLLDGYARWDMYQASPGVSYRYWYDFPDRCVVVTEGQSLQIIDTESHGMHAHIIGYFYDVP